MTFNVASSSSDICVDLNNDSVIIFISESTGRTEVRVGTFADLASGQSIDAYGLQGSGGCFQATGVVVDLTGQP